MEMLLRPLERLGRRTASSVAGLGYAGMLLVESLYFIAWGWRRGQPVRLRMVLEQMRQVGVDAVPIVEEAPAAPGPGEAAFAPQNG